MKKDKDIYKNAIEKKVHWSIEAIKNLKDEKPYFVNTPDIELFKNSKSLIKYENGEFEIKILLDDGPNSELFNNPENLFKDKTLIFERSSTSVTTIHLDGNDIRNISQTLSSPFVITYTSKRIKTVSENTLGFHRRLIPLNKKPNFEPFACNKLNISQILYYGLIKIQLHEKEYEVFHYENKDLKEYYLIIDTTEKMTSSEFQDNCESLLFSLSLFNGNFHDGEFYDIQLNDWEENWKYDTITFTNNKNSVLSNVQIVHPYKFQSYLKHIKKEEHLERIGMFVTDKKISVIANNLHKKKKIQRIINLILEANSTKSLILRCCTYSIALETLTNIIYEKNYKANKAIKNEQLEELLIKKINEVVDEYNHLDKEDIDIDSVKKKIKNLGKPINQDKLTKSFEILNIKLNDADIKALKSRNSFLHGSSPIKNFETNYDKEVDLSLLSTKLNNLTTCLLMKYLGFSGAITNSYSFKKSNLGKPVEEHFFRILK